MKRLSWLTAGFCVGFLIACGHAGLKVKVYQVDGSKDALVRKQSNESIPIPQANGYYCTSPSDFEALIEAYQQCIHQPVDHGLRIGVQ